MGGWEEERGTIARRLQTCSSIVTHTLSVNVRMVGLPVNVRMGGLLSANTTTRGAPMVELAKECNISLMRPHPHLQFFILWVLTGGVGYEAR